MTPEEKRIIADRNGRVALDWGSVNEFNFWFDEGTRVLHVYNPQSLVEVGVIQFAGMPPHLLAPVQTGLSGATMTLSANAVLHESLGL